MTRREPSARRGSPSTDVGSKPFDSVELAAALRNVPALLMILSPDLHVTWMNEYMARVFGIDSDTSLGQHWYELVPMMEQRDEQYQRVVRGEQLDYSSVELPFPTGSRYFAVHYRPIVHEPGEPASVFVIAHEITTKVLANQLLDEKQTRLDFLNSLVRMIRAGHTVDEILRSTTDEISRRFPELRVASSEVRGGHVSVRYSSQPHGMRSLSGFEMDLTRAPRFLDALEKREAVVAADVAKDDRLAPVAEAMQTNQACGTLVVPLFDRNSLVGCLCLDSAEPHDWSEGEIHMLSEIAEYVSIAIREARFVEREERLEAHLSQRQKMESLGSLAGGIAHDFNNILQGIHLQIRLAREAGVSGETRDESLVEAAKLIRRGKELVEQILVFSRRDEVELKPVRVVQPIENAVKLIRATLPATIDIRSDFDDRDCCVMGDETQIGQIVVNLCTNAAYSMREGGGMLEVALKKTRGADEAVSFPTLGEGSYAKLTVRDSGVGMSSEVRARAREPFFTTKPVGEGTGMGLAVVHGIVEGHEGAMRIESGEGEGTKVEVFLKACEADCEIAEVAAIPSTRGVARVLLVDDEDAVRDSGQALLELRGYRVAAAANGVDALELLGHGEFDVVVTDQTMPGMTGIQLSEQIVRLLPDLPVILITGRSESATPERAREIGIRRVLRKPVDFDEIVRAVEGVLAGKTSE